jgi:hypothetical protein
MFETITIDGVSPQATTQNECRVFTHFTPMQMKLLTFDFNWLQQGKKKRLLLLTQLNVLTYIFENELLFHSLLTRY